MTRRPVDAHDDAACWRRWTAAVREPAVSTAVRELYERLNAAVAEQPGVCELSGRCCRFDSYGHRLYVTGLEVAWLVEHLDAEQRRSLEEAQNPETLDGCVFQRQGLCSVHTLRPMGCRIFFCDPAAETWQHAVYEQFLTELRTLHEQFHLPYRYMEWRTALAERQRLTPADR